MRNLLQYVRSSPLSFRDGMGLYDWGDWEDPGCMGIGNMGRMIEQIEHEAAVAKSQQICSSVNFNSPRCKEKCCTREKCERTVLHILETANRTSVWPFWPGECQRWISAFEYNLDWVMAPRCIVERGQGWEPSNAAGGGHAFYYFVLCDELTVKVDHWIFYGGTRITWGG